MRGWDGALSVLWPLLSFQNAQLEVLVEHVPDRALITAYNSSLLQRHHCSIAHWTIAKI